MATDTFEVKVHIYDLSRGMARAMSMAFLGKQLDGIWHTGIVVYGKEFYYGGTGGIETCPPGGTILGPPDTVHVVGQTQIPYEMFLDYLAEQAQSSYKPTCYHLFEHNCNNFSSEVAQFLTGNDIPSHITSLPSDVLSTPFGQMIKPFVDAMTVQPSGGQALFSSETPPTTHSQAISNDSKPAQASTASVSHSVRNETTPPSVTRPLIYSQDLPSTDSWKTEKFHLSPEEMALVTEIYDYLQQADVSWSLGRNHLETVCSLTVKADRGCLIPVLQLLQKLLLYEDVIQVLKHDPNTSFPNLLKDFDMYHDSEKEEILKMLCNACSTAGGHELILADVSRVTLCKHGLNICVSSLLGDSKNLYNTAAGLCYNICRYMVSDDVQLEVGTALLNCLEKQFSEPAAYHALTALKQFMTDSQEVRGLKSVLGINLESVRKLSVRVGSLCEEIEAIH